MKELLEKIRNLNSLVQKNLAVTLDFADLAKVVCDSVEASTYIIDNEGCLLGHSMDEAQICETMVDITERGGAFPPEYNQALQSIVEPAVNIKRRGICTFYADRHCHLGNKYSTIVPIIGGGERLGSLVLSKLSEFHDDDLILSEYCATLVGMEIIRTKMATFANEAREKEALHVATKALSYSEVEALLYLFQDFHHGEGIINASKIAKEAAITRSLIVSAIRKLEGAGVIEACSLGVKGTHIKIINHYLTDELHKMGKKYEDYNN